MLFLLDLGISMLKNKYENWKLGSTSKYRSLRLNPNVHSYIRLLTLGFVYVSTK